MKRMKRYIFCLTILTSLSTIILATVVLKKKQTKNNHLQPIIPTKYHYDIMSVLRESLGSSPRSIAHDHIINKMTKINVIERYFSFTDLPITSDRFKRVLNQVFGLNLNKISEDGEGAKLFIYPEEIMVCLRKKFSQINSTIELDQHIMNLKKSEVMDIFIKTNNSKTYEDMITIIKLIYGINLQGISSLEHSRISLYTKNQWLLKNDRDLFVVYTGKGDIDVRVYPTTYYIEKTGLNEIPLTLQHALNTIGFTYKREFHAYYYKNINGETVPDSFKGQTLRAIRSVIETELKDL